MYFLDCTGKTCPLPVLETKRLLEEKAPDELKVAVDNGVSRENVRRFLESRGYQVSVEGQEQETLLVASRNKREEGLSPVNGEKRITAFIAGETLGRGNDQLGSILMKSFIFTLKELTPLPWRVIFINGGVRLASEGSELLPHLRDLENLGVELLSCGTCLDFFGLKEKLKAGRASNMFEILSSLAESTSVLEP